MNVPFSAPFSTAMAGTDRTAEPLLGGPAVVLVRPQLGENIGAVARAMLNFGLTELRLVAPRDGWPSEKARAAASRADRVLDNARLYATAAEAVADMHLVVATTARKRDIAKVVATPREAAQAMREAMAEGRKVALLFGAERTGLENDEYALAHLAVRIPANPGFSSLNLAQAVLLLGYEWFQAAHASAQGRTGPTDRSPSATMAELVNFYERLEAELDEAGFLWPEDKRPSMVQNIRAMFQRASLTEQEVRTLHGMVKALARLRERRRRT
jgi:tRNA/rRNA methyltransferase